MKRFVAATRASYELAAQQPEEAVKALLAARPTLESALSLAQLRTGMTLMKSTYGRDRPIGWMAQQDWDDTLALMKEYQGLETTLPAASFWTDAYMAP